MYNNNDSYDYLARNLVTFTRKDKHHIAVYTVGYVSSDCMTIESNLRQLDDFKVVSRKFDGKIGKTVTIYKHK